MFFVKSENEVIIHCNATTSDSLITEEKAAMDRFPKLKRLSGRYETNECPVCLEDPITMKEFTNNRKSRCTIFLSTGRHKPDNQYASSQWHISSILKVVAILDE